MNSKLFSRFSLDSDGSKEFVPDLQYFLSIDEKKQKEIVALAIRTTETRTSSEDQKLFDETSKSVHMEITQLHRATKFVLFWLNQMIDDSLENDTPDKWVLDLVQLNIIKNEDANRALIFLNYLCEIGKSRFDKTNKRNAYRNGVLPVLKGFAHTVEMRAIFNDQYQIGDQIEDYQPNILDTIPIVSFSITTRTSIGDKKFTFQATEEDVSNLIDELKSTLVEIEAMSNWYNTLGKRG